MSTGVSNKRGHLKNTTRILICRDRDFFFLNIFRELIKSTLDSMASLPTLNLFPYEKLSQGQGAGLCSADIAAWDQTSVLR